MSFSKIAATVQRKQVAHNVVQAILRKKADFGQPPSTSQQGALQGDLQHYQASHTDSSAQQLYEESFQENIAKELSKKRRAAIREKLHRRRSSPTPASQSPTPPGSVPMNKRNAYMNMMQLSKYAKSVEELFGVDSNRDDLQQAPSAQTTLGAAPSSRPANPPSRRPGPAPRSTPGRGRGVPITDTKKDQLTPNGERVAVENPTPIDRNPIGTGNISLGRYGSDPFLANQRHIRNNYLSHRFGPYDQWKDKYGWVDWLNGDWTDDARRKSLVRRDSKFPGFNAESRTLYSQFVKDGQHIRPQDLQQLINNRSYYLAKHILRNRQQGGAQISPQLVERMAAQLRLGADDTLNGINGVGYQTVKGQIHPQQRTANNQGRNILPDWKDQSWKGFTNDQIRQAQHLAHLMLYDEQIPDKEYNVGRVATQSPFRRFVLGGRYGGKQDLGE